MADLPEWIKKLEHYECDGQMELEDYLRVNRKEAVHNEKGHIRADFRGNLCSVPENGDSEYTH